VSVTKPGDVILLDAIGGGVGLFATQLAVRAGATVIGTVGTKGRETRALAYGVAKVFNREEEDFVEAGGLHWRQGRRQAAGLDWRQHPRPQFLDHPQAWPCRELRRGRGPAVSQSLGKAGREVVHFHPLSSRPGRLSFRRLAPIHRRGRGRIMDGSLKVPLEETFAFSEACAMLDRLGSRQVAGKLILAVNPS
jgi:NADPH2:quinone reductase